MWTGGISIEQVHSLEPIFATYRGDLGWVMPNWLLELKMEVIIRDQSLLAQKNQNSS